MSKTAPVVILCILILAMGFAFGAAWQQTNTEAVTITQYIDRWQPPEIIEVEKLIYIDRIVEVEKPIIVDREAIRIVEIAKEVLPEWWSDFAKYDYIPFKSNEEVKQYVLETGIPARKYVRDVYDCENFAMDLALQAMRDRRPIGLYIEGIHASCFAIVGNRAVGVDPQTGQVTTNFMDGFEVRLDP